MEKLGLAIAKIGLIKEASDRHDGHAIGNFARFYVEAGFCEDADRLLRELPKEVAASEQVIAAKQYLYRLQKEQEEKKAQLVREADILAQHTSSFNFSDQFAADKAVGGGLTLMAKPHSILKKNRISNL